MKLGHVQEKWSRARNRLGSAFGLVLIVGGGIAFGLLVVALFPAAGSLTTETATEKTTRIGGQVLETVTETVTEETTDLPLLGSIRRRSGHAFPGVFPIPPASPPVVEPFDVSGTAPAEPLPAPSGGSWSLASVADGATTPDRLGRLPGWSVPWSAFAVESPASVPVPGFVDAGKPSRTAALAVVGKARGMPYPRQVFTAGRNVADKPARLALRVNLAPHGVQYVAFAIDGGPFQRVAGVDLKETIIPGLFAFKPRADEMREAGAVSRVEITREIRPGETVTFALGATHPAISGGQSDNPSTSAALAIECVGGCDFAATTPPALAAMRPDQVKTGQPGPGLPTEYVAGLVTFPGQFVNGLMPDKHAGTYYPEGAASGLRSGFVSGFLVADRAGVWELALGERVRALEIDRPGLVDLSGLDDWLEPLRVTHKRRFLPADLVESVPVMIRPPGRLDWRPAEAADFAVRREVAEKARQAMITAARSAGKRSAVEAVPAIAPLRVEVGESANMLDRDAFASTLSGSTGDETGSRAGGRLARPAAGGEDTDRPADEVNP